MWRAGVAEARQARDGDCRTLTENAAVLAGWRGDRPADSVVLPGDAVAVLAGEIKVKIGPGMRRDGARLVAAKAGVVRGKGTTTYVAVQDESVIGVVRERAGESYRVDIGTSQPATLSMLAFEGATKRNRPNLRVGSTVYARLSLANKDMEPELVCVGPDNRSGGYGELEGGFTFATTLTWAQRLLAPECAVLTALGAHMPFEICVGLNGRVWVNSSSAKYTVLVANAIQSAEPLTEKQTAALVRDLIARL